MLTSIQLTTLLNQAAQKTDETAAAVYDLVYRELHRIAARYMARESPSHTLEVTGLVHEAYLELVADHDRHWQNRAHFYAYAARLMRHILVRHAKKKQAEKRGGGRLRTTISGLAAEGSDHFDLLALDEAMQQLECWDARKARVLELRFLAGLSIEEVALVTGLSQPSVYKDLKVAKGWLHHKLARNTWQI